MGSVFSVFRKKEKPLAELIQEYEEKITEISMRRQEFLQNQRKILSWLLFSGIFLEFSYLLLFYFYFLKISQDYREKMFYFLPFGLIFVISFLIRTIVNRYYKYRLARNEKKLKEMRKIQEKKIEEFVESTNFLKTREVIERYHPSPMKYESNVTPVQSPAQGFRRRHTQTPSKMNHIPKTQQAAQTTPRIPKTPIPQPNLQTPKQKAPRQFLQQSPKTPQTPASNSSPNRPPLSSSQENSNIFINSLSNIVNFLVGDTPNSSCALVCSQCGEHNGLIPKQEMNSINFRCRYCHFFNERKKQSRENPLENVEPKLSENAQTKPSENEQVNSSENEEMNSSENPETQLEKNSDKSNETAM